MPRSRIRVRSLESPHAEAAFRAHCAAALREALPNELQHWGATPLDANAVAGLATRLAECIASRLAQEAASSAASPEWISTQEAANRSGFSRPFVAALLDSGAYEGQIHRTPVGGHRKVRADEFAAFMAKASAAPSLDEARRSAELREPPGQPAPSEPARAASRVRAAALAKKLGLA